MPTKIVRPLKDVDNTALLNAIRRDASLEYRQRVPEITDGKIQKTIESIMEFQGIKNEMLDSLINRIGRVIARNNSWSNPLAIFKQGLLTYGSTVEEIQMGLISARVMSMTVSIWSATFSGPIVPTLKPVSIVSTGKNTIRLASMMTSCVVHS